MVYILAFAIAFILIVLYLHYRNRERKKEIAEELRKQWGKQKDTDFHFTRIEAYDVLSGEETFHKVSNQTVNDIDFNELFCFIDRTVSKPGQQYFYTKLKHPSNS